MDCLSNVMDHYIAHGRGGESSKKTRMVINSSCNFFQCMPREIKCGILRER